MANPEHLELVRSGVDALNAYAAAHGEVALDLEGADLSGLALAGARLQAARLAHTSLRGCDLRNARFNSADMRGCDLRDADLRGASVHRADLTGADLRGARFDTFGVGGQRLCVSPASFQDARWEREHLEAILSLINLNPDWEVRYEIVARTGGRAP